MTDAILDMVGGMQLGQHFEKILMENVFLLPFGGLEIINMETYFWGIHRSEEGEVHVQVREIVPVSEKLLLLVLAPRLGQALPQLHAH